MAIYRGIGGAGENNQDATITAVTQQATLSVDSAIASAVSAAESLASSNTADEHRIAAASSELFAEGYATAAGTSLAAAVVAQTETGLLRDGASANADAAFQSATAAALSETNAAASEVAAAASEVAAAASETNAALSEAASLAIYGDTVDVAAAVDAAALSEAAAAASEAAAAASEAAALVSEGNASDSASAASTSETNAAASEAAAATSETNAAATYDAFDDRYLGSKSSDPSVDNDGGALLTGALYFDSVTGVMKVFSGVSWLAAYASSGGALNAVNNLSDVASIPTARSNLGLGTAAVEDVSAFITPNSTATLFALTTTNGLDVGGDLVVAGDLTVNGTTTTVNATNLAVADNMIYLNAGSTVTDPDLGFVGNYNDGTYAHAGLFRDATDGRWKVFKGYTPEPDESPAIDTSHASFTLADIQATTFYGALSGNASTATLAATATNVAYSGLTGTAPTWNQNTTGNAATADYATIAGSANAVPYANLTGTIPTWNQNTTGNAATATYATSAGNATTANSATTAGNAATATNAAGAFTVPGALTVGNSASSAINMVDTDEGTRIIHCNSNNIGFLTQAGGWGAYCDDTGNWTAAGNVTAYSDERLKKDWEEVKPNFVDQLANVKSGTYTRTDSDERQAGVSAQSLQELLPETVITGGDGMLSVAYGNAAMVAVVALAKEVVALRLELNKLKGV